MEFSSVPGKKASKLLEMLDFLAKYLQNLFFGNGSITEFPASARSAVEFSGASGKKSSTH